MNNRLTILAKVRRFFRRENGTQMVELAVAVPVMLIMLASLAEFGRFFYTYTTLTSAVRAGARHACKWQRNSSWTFDETSKMVVYGDFGGSGTAILPGLTTSNVTVTANGPAVNNIDSVTVRIVGYNYVPIFDVGKITGIQSLSLAIPLNASATMHQLYNGPTADQ